MKKIRRVEEMAIMMANSLLKSGFNRKSKLQGKYIFVTKCGIERAQTKSPTLMAKGRCQA